MLCSPVQEGFELEHNSEVVTDTLEEFLNGGRVAQERDRHLDTAMRDVALCQHVCYIQSGSRREWGD